MLPLYFFASVFATTEQPDGYFCLWRSPDLGMVSVVVVVVLLLLLLLLLLVGATFVLSDLCTIQKNL